MLMVGFESIWSIMKNALEHWCSKLQNLAEFSLSVLNFGLLNPKVQPFITQNLSTFWRKTLIDKFKVWYEIFILGSGAKNLVAWISSYGLAKLGIWTLFSHNLVKFSNFSRLPFLQVTLISWLILDQMQLWTIFSWIIGHDEHFCPKSQTLTFGLRWILCRETLIPDFW